MEIDHIGIVVSNIEETLKHYTKDYGYTCLKGVFLDSSRGVRLALLISEDNLCIELIQPIDKKSPSYDFMTQGGGIHHFCYRVKDIEKTIQHFRKKEHLLIQRPSEATLMDKNKVAFMFSKKDKQIIEFIESVE